MPFESIVELDTGWTWGAVDFLPAMTQGSARLALERFSDVANINRDWRSLTSDLQPPPKVSRMGRLPALPGLPGRYGPQGFKSAILEARRPNSQLWRALQPYGARFAKLMERPVLLQCFGLAAVASVAWDASLGPALAALSSQALGKRSTPAELREKICGNVTDAAEIKVDIDTVARLLAAAGVPWAA
eukprot:NODE_3170_length_820_cov_224.341176.p1 GENE.NODE_3170_length_820_cov_224.341176~~NODE_3170_length_820_cov_224.341176.p1  ORF type:complete len:220 (-),score=64.49 NODE_3170_length_820_cov_224.341176:143-706(-)